MNAAIFHKAHEKQFQTLNQYVPVVAKVHGGTHPEFYEVHTLFDAINKKAGKINSENLELKDEFEKLREITKNYTVPNDVCETFEAVYKLLEELDDAYYTK